jgi:hypothetical protein
MPLRDCEDVQTCFPPQRLLTARGICQVFKGLFRSAHTFAVQILSALERVISVTENVEACRPSIQDLRAAAVTVRTRQPQERAASAEVGGYAAAANAVKTMKTLQAKSRASTAAATSPPLVPPTYAPPGQAAENQTKQIRFFSS